MLVYRSIDEFKSKKNAIVTIGTFDGVHIGHQKVIKRVNEIAKMVHGESVVLTFFPHPRMVLSPENHGLLLLNTLEEKIQLLRKYGIQHLIIHPFSTEFSRTSVTEYVRDILVNKIGTRKLVIGYDHHFGRNREGSLKSLVELAPLYHFEVEQIPEQDINHIAISSTKIREALLAGDIVTARNFLGHDYSLTGIVIKGKQIGRSLGFPTANIEVEESYKLIPAKGIYAVQVKIDPDERVFNGMLSIGSRPTFDDGPVSIEVNILNFDKDIYGAEVTVIFKQRLRDEVKFNSAEELVVQMEKDKKETENIFAQD